MTDKSLDEVLAEIEALVARATADRRSAWRHPTFLTIGREGQPEGRSVVLRRFDPATRHFEIHTDRRSAKIEELAKEPRSGLHFYDPGKALQLRVSGVAREAGADVAEARWQGLSELGRQIYCVEPAPGTPLDDPRTAQRGAEAVGEKAFAVLQFQATQYEWLSLARSGQRRARFSFTEAGALDAATWLSP